ncbi:hypothetical protein DFA_05730 [Cavenderia fasciculata]|uniref:Lipase n=1 Tax=Cavenderia fasciculata TaxID=261658 RepID=F4PM96_CACFS|nr:uncharacterized protein DFA_05730 [Cavenderia fasciculata]EGG23596.1 hypothetical protein DFA_05730 [Cavenderia fasciculata]|eukprot:XP_004361447.1 hypothetical protein DFA_05730 [Cavenderia fasciculata]
MKFVQSLLLLFVVIVSIVSSTSIIESVKAIDPRLYDLILSQLGGSNPDLNRNITQLIEARGYPVEQHVAVTPDGYILSIQRIPAGRYQPNPNPNRSNGKPAVLLQHGVEDIGVSWVNQENVYQSLGFILADAGFDVWINNVRGTYLSNTNIYYTSDQVEYWQFSFDEMAEYDLPTAMNYVLRVTGNSKISYVGHSQGTTMGFIGFANETLASKIDLFVALAPVVRVTHCKSTFLNLLAKYDVADLFVLLGDKSFLIQTPGMQKFLQIICTFDPSICQNSLALIMGWDTANINSTRLPVYMSHEPGGTSVQNVLHWSQAVKTGYQKFDYGTKGNLAHYGQATPPQYNISAFNAPVIIFYGSNDYLADPVDVQWLIPQLPTLLYNKYIQGYSHLDFVWGENAYLDVYQEVTQYLLQYTSN